MFRKNIQRVVHFIEVAKRGGLSSTARELGLSQPALTASIRKLEEQIGFELFDRKSGFELTQRGREFLVHAASATSMLDDLERYSESIRTGEMGEVRLASGPTVADGMVGEAIGRLLASYPDLIIRVKVVPFEEMPMMLRERKIDFFVGDYTLLSGVSDLEITPLPAQEIIFYGRKGHPLARDKKISAEEFFSYPHVGTSLPQWAEDWLRKSRPKGKSAPFLRLECSHHALLKKVVEASDAMSGAPREIIEDEIVQGRFSRIQPDLEPIHNRAGIVWLINHPPSEAAKLLIKELVSS